MQSLASQNVFNPELHNRAKLVGYLQGNGDKLVSEKDNQTYSLSNQQNET